MSTTDAPFIDQFEFSQLAFDLDAPVVEAENPTGVDIWQEELRRNLEESARFHGLPIGHRVRAEFRGGPALEGKLLLDGVPPAGGCRADSHLALRIGAATFHADELTACIRLD